MKMNVYTSDRTAVDCGRLSSEDCADSDGDNCTCGWMSIH